MGASARVLILALAIFHEWIICENEDAILTSVLVTSPFVLGKAGSTFVERPLPVIHEKPLPSPSAKDALLSRGGGDPVVKPRVLADEIFPLSTDVDWGMARKSGSATRRGITRGDEGGGCEVSFGHRRVGDGVVMFVEGTGDDVNISLGGVGDDVRNWIGGPRCSNGALFVCSFVWGRSVAAGTGDDVSTCGGGSVGDGSLVCLFNRFSLSRKLDLLIIEEELERWDCLAGFVVALPLLLAPEYPYK